MAFQYIISERFLKEIMTSHWLAKTVRSIFCFHEKKIKCGISGQRNEKLNLKCLWPVFTLLFSQYICLPVPTRLWTFWVLIKPIDVYHTMHQ